MSESPETRHIRIPHHAVAKKFVRSGGEIVGVVIKKNNKSLNIRAKHGVVLATGGFEYNENFKREYLAGYPIFAYGNPGNTGDGIKLAQELGADLWHMKAVAAPMAFKVTGFESAFI